MPYKRQLPDAPIALSMLPEVETPTENDLLCLVQPNNKIGRRSKSISLKKLNNSGLVSPEKVVISPAPDSGNWTVDLGTLKDTNRLVLVQNANSPKTSCSITLSGTQPSSASILDIVVVYGSWTGNLTLVGLSARDYILSGADGEWMRGVIAADGKLSQYSIMGHLFNNSSQGFSGESGMDSFSIGLNGLNLDREDSHGDSTVAQIFFDGDNWNMSGIHDVTVDNLTANEKITTPHFKVKNGFLDIDSDSVRMITTAGAYTELMDHFNSMEAAPYGVGYMRVVLNISSGNVEVRYLAPGATSTSTYNVINLSVGECALLFCCDVHLCDDNKYRNGWASVAT